MSMYSPFSHFKIVPIDELMNSLVFPGRVTYSYYVVVVFVIFITSFVVVFVIFFTSFVVFDIFTCVVLVIFLTSFVVEFVTLVVVVVVFVKVSFFVTTAISSFLIKSHCPFTST